jgi:hypothetical protein
LNPAGLAAMSVPTVEVVDVVEVTEDMAWVGLSESVKVLGGVGPQDGSGGGVGRRS